MHLMLQFRLNYTTLRRFFLKQKIVQDRLNCTIISTLKTQNIKKSYKAQSQINDYLD